MTQSNSQLDSSQLSISRSPSAGRTLKIVVHASLAPDQPMGWRLRIDSELRAQAGAVWLTREGALDDYWLRPGDALNLRRRQRIWLSAEGGEPAQITLTSYYVERRRLLTRWLRGIQAWVSGSRGVPLGI